MTEWVSEQVDLLHIQWPDLTYVETGHWVLLPGWPLPDGWSVRAVDVACRIPEHSQQPPYAFYVNAATPTFNGDPPGNWTPSAAVPFSGDWSMFSWSPDAWWSAAGHGHPNMLTFVRSFADRFAEGA